MTVIRCSFEGCKTLYETNDLVTEDVRFICKHHTRQEQVEALGREYTFKDDVDTDLKFQECQFDKNIPRPISKYSVTIDNFERELVPEDFNISTVNELEKLEEKYFESQEE